MVIRLARPRAHSPSLVRPGYTGRHRRPPGRWRRLARLAVGPLVVALLVLGPAAADAATGPPVILAVKTLPEVIAGLQSWILKLAFAIASLYGAYAALLLITAGGDTEQVSRGKTALRNALLGYALAFLAPVLLGIVKTIIGAG